MNRNHCAMRQAETVPVSMLPVEEDAVVFKEGFESGVELISNAKQEYGMLKHAMESMCLVYMVFFKGCWSLSRIPVRAFSKECKMQCTTHRIFCLRS